MRLPSLERSRLRHFQLLITFTWVDGHLPSSLSTFTCEVRVYLPLYSSGTSSTTRQTSSSNSSPSILLFHHTSSPQPEPSSATMYVFTAIIGMMATLAIPVLSRALLERIPPGAGYGYDEASFHGNESTLPVGPHIMTRLRSAKVTPGFTCNFYKYEAVPFMVHAPG